MHLADLLEPAIQLAQRAGVEILKVYSDDFDVEQKSDQTPVTRADLAAHHVICDGLRKLTPEIPIISEEAGLPDFGLRRTWHRYWLVDPLDGTREFVNRNDEFTVNIALIDNHRPVLGVVYVPVLGVTFAAAEGSGATRQSAGSDPVPLEVSERCSTPPRVAGSRSHRGASLDAVLETIGDVEFVPLGSSLKFCRIAEGTVDFYPRLGPTSEWDTAAAQAVVEQAGGAVVTLSGEPLSYNQEADILNPHFLVIGPQDRDWLALVASAQPPQA